MGKSKSMFDRKPDKVKQFQASSKGVTEVNKRDMEVKLLKPENIVKYTGDEPKHKSDLSARTVLIVFRNTAQMELIGNLFEIRESKVNHDTYITNIQLLETIAQNVKDGTMGIVNGQIVLLPVSADDDDAVLEALGAVADVDPEATSDLEPEVLEAAKKLKGKKGKKKGHKIKIRAAEIEYKKDVYSIEALNKLVLKMYEKPWKYADVGKGDSGYYDFLKYLYIVNADGEGGEINFISYVDQLKKQ